MQYRFIGASDLEVSAIGFGCWGISGGPMWGAQDESESIDALHAALDAGINFFDTAEMYGAGYSEEVLGKALADRRDRAIIASKVWPTNLEPSALRKACETSLERLQTEMMDLYQIHWPVTPGDPDSAVETLRALRDEGKVRYLGVSNFGPKDLAQYPDDLFVSNQVAYNLLFRASEFAVNPATSERNMSTITYSSLLHGILAGKMQSADDVPAGRARTRHFSSAREQVRHDEPGHEELTFETVAAIRNLAESRDTPMRDLALGWVLARPGVATVLVGARTVEQARSSAAIGAESLPNDVVAELDRITDPLKQALGPNPDMWQTESRMR